jgi:hypothetical protein
MLSDMIFEATRPSDAIEILLATDAIRHTWDLHSDRRGTDQLFLISSHHGAYAVLRPILGAEKAREVADLWRLRIPCEVEGVETALKMQELTHDAIRAETLANRLDLFERVDRLTAAKEARRNSALRELDRHRVALASQRPAVVDEIEAEFTELPVPGEPWVPGEDERPKRLPSSQAGSAMVPPDERPGCPDIKGWGGQVAEKGAAEYPRREDERLKRYVRT